MSGSIGVDTNVLLRGLLADDPEQLARAGRILEVGASAPKVFVNCVVLAEVFLFENHGAVEAALSDYRSGLGDFSDRLIARINEAHGTSQTFTFDRKAARHPPLALVP
ncbi:MAG: PIN domain-containing protein [Salinarimonas sp.]